MREIEQAGRRDDLELIGTLPAGIETTARILRSEPMFKTGQRFGAVPGANIEGYTPKRLAEVLTDLQKELQKNPDFSKDHKAAEEFLDSHAVINFEHLSLSVLDLAKNLAGDSARFAGGHYWKEAENIRKSLEEKYKTVPGTSRTKAEAHRFHKGLPAKVTFGIASLALAVDACAPMSVGPVMPIERDTPTATEVLPTATPTETATPTPTEVVEMDRPLEIISTDSVENVRVQGVVVNGSFDVDETAKRNDLDKVSLPDSLGAEILLKVAAWLDWFHGNSPHENTDPSDQDITAFAEKLAKVQSGELPCSEVQSTIFAYDANKPSEKMEEIDVALFCGEGEVPEGVQRIDNVRIVYVSGYEWDAEKSEYVNRADMPRFTVMKKLSGYGYETLIDGNTMLIKVGLGYLSEQWNIQNTTAAHTTFMFQWLAHNNGNHIQKYEINNSYSGRIGKGKILIEKGFRAE